VPAPQPRPGRPARGSRSGRPIMVLLDFLGRRWTLRAHWELRESPATFNELQARCDGVSPSVLSRRLKEARELGTVEQGPDGRYRLTRQGRRLGELLLPLDAWARDWARGLARRGS